MCRQAQDLVPSEVDRSHDQLASMWKVIVADRGGDDLRRLPGMTVRWAESRFPFWNTLILSEEISTRKHAEEILAQASSYVRGKRQHLV